MQTKKDENSKQESGHKSRRKIKHRVARAVGGIGMRVILGEIGVGKRMAALTGADDSVYVDRRTRIRFWQHVVGTMAIRTTGDAGKSQSRHLAVKRIPIGLERLRVAGAALTHDLQLPRVHIDAFDFVRRMAIDANRRPRIVCREGFSVNAIGKGIQHSGMTLAASFRHAPAVDRRLGIGARQNPMGAMATRAIGRH